MSELDKINTEMRLSAIRAVLRNHPEVLKEIIAPDGQGINLKATPDELDMIEPMDILVRVAWDIWNGTGETEFDKVLDQLPPEDFEAFIDAMKGFAELRRRIWSSYATGAEND
ncbi:MAG: hypothetical protein ACNS63_01110 [Candidatus Nitrospinota bacterium M3_3B_026]